MRHFVPLDTGAGWGVCYRNFRGEFVTVMECTTLEVAYEQAAQMTRQAFEDALGAASFARTAMDRAAREIRP